MSRVVRIKRHLEEEPASVLYLAKKSRQENSIQLKFAGTVDQNGSPAPKALPEPDGLESAAAAIKRRVPGGACRLRRVEAVHNFLLPEVKETSLKRKAVEVYDVVLEDAKKTKVSEEIACNGVAMEVHATDPDVVEAKRVEHGYVYDLYVLPDGEDYATCLNDPIFYLESDPFLSDRTLYNDYRDLLDEDEDSNAEDNPRNDYPDEEGDSGDEDDNYYCRGVEDELRDFERLTMGTVEESDDDSLGGHEDGGDFYGYDAYKKRICKELEDDPDDEDSDD